MNPKDTVPDGPAEPPVQVEVADRADPEVFAPEVPPVPVTPFPEAPVPVPPFPGASVEEPPGPQAVPVKRRPRGRTTLIVAAAALLGIAGGTAVGYGVQAERAPTPLTALSQPDLAYPAKALPAGQAPDPLPASQDRRVHTDGDLRKLVAPRPAGWQDDKSLAVYDKDGWLEVEDYALEFEDEDYMYSDLLETDVRRVAAKAWKKGEYRTAAVYLVQFHSGAAAAAHAEGQRLYMPDAEHGAGNEGSALKGSGTGRYYVFPAERKAGYLPLYHARAIFHRGDVMVDIHIYDSASISKKDIRTMAERQLERL
ncbi:hypothetical protein [Streptomyces sp. BE230]|uniref:hypothetical protein n=1 Tax=Streptomyces sp. BE230 TaxID=3002526 RepID=UPI002ED2818F|nr:hypothetical protein [Streptomyces sp. BE230]